MPRVLITYDDYSRTLPLRDLRVRVDSVVANDWTGQSLKSRLLIVIVPPRYRRSEQSDNLFNAARRAGAKIMALPLESPTKSNVQLQETLLAVRGIPDCLIATLGLPSETLASLTHTRHAPLINAGNCDTDAIGALADLLVVTDPSSRLGSRGGVYFGEKDARFQSISKAFASIGCKLQSVTPDQVSRAAVASAAQADSTWQMIADVDFVYLGRSAHKALAFLPNPELVIKQLYEKTVLVHETFLDYAEITFAAKLWELPGFCALEQSRLRRLVTAAVLEHAAESGPD